MGNKFKIENLNKNSSSSNEFEFNENVVKKSLKWIFSLSYFILLVPFIPSYEVFKLDNFDINPLLSYSGVALILYFLLSLVVPFSNGSLLMLIKSIKKFLNNKKVKKKIKLQLIENKISYFSESQKNAERATLMFFGLYLFFIGFLKNVVGVEMQLFSNYNLLSDVGIVILRASLILVSGSFFAVYWTESLAFGYIKSELMAHRLKILNS